MATLSSSATDAYREAYRQRAAIPATVLKADLNAAFQAVDTWWDADRSQGVTAIENAVPGKFTQAQKVVIMRCWMRDRFSRDGG